MKEAIPVFGYLRFSGLGQADGDSIARQKESIETFCSRNGYRVLRWFQDEAVSGEVEAMCRDSFAEMLSLCGEATTQLVVVERADRLARTLMVSELACEEARKLNIKIFTADSGTELTDDSDPTRVMIRQVMGVLAEWNKNVTVKRLRAARERIRKTAGRCEGRRAFGNRGLDHEIETLALITVLRVNHGWSYGAIAKELNRRRRPTAGGQMFWDRSTVFRMLDRQRSLKEEPQKIRPELLPSIFS